MTEVQEQIVDSFTQLYKNVLSGWCPLHVANLEHDAKVTALRWLFLNSLSYEELIDYLEEWFNDHAEEYDLSHPRMIYSGDSLIYVVCRPTVQYDSDIQDIISKLSIDITSFDCLQNIYNSVEDVPPLEYNPASRDETIIYDFAKGENQDYEQLSA